MNTELATNYLTIPLYLIVLAGTGFLVVRHILRTRGAPKQMLLRIAAGFLIMIGSLTVLTVAYTSLNQTFRGTMQIYVMTHLPEVQNDPEFNDEQSGYSNVFAAFGVSDDNGKRVIFPKNQAEKYMQFYAPGSMKFGTVTDGVVVINDALTMPTSLWWLLSKNPYAVTSTASDAEVQLP